MAKRGTMTVRGQVINYAGGLEESMLKQLDEKLPRGLPIVYEPGIIRFVVPAKKAWYKLDFALPNGIILEGKGQFDSKERKKFRAIKEQYPDLDIRFVFSNPNAKIGSKSQTTYAMWCDKVGFKYAKKIIPQEWIDEPRDEKRIAAARAAIDLK